MNAEQEHRLLKEIVKGYEEEIKPNLKTIFDAQARKGIFLSYKEHRDKNLPNTRWYASIQKAVLELTGKNVPKEIPLEDNAIDEWVSKTFGKQSIIIFNRAVDIVEGKDQKDKANVLKERLLWKKEIIKRSKK